MSALRLRSIALRNAIRQFIHMPLSSLLNTLVIGFAVSFPLGLYTLMTNLEGVIGQLPQHNQITLYLQTGTGTAEIRALQTRLQQYAELSDIRLIDRQQALEAMKQTGMGAILDSLPDNPLPDAFVLTPKSADPAALQKLTSTLRALPQVEAIQHDNEWARRLAAILDFGHRLTLMLAAALGLALLVVVANSIRMQVLTKRDEIEVSKLIGATNTFIRRPFAYFGALQGLLGALTGIACVASALYWLEPDVKQVASLYAADFSLRMPDIAGLALTVITTAILCWAGALLAVNRHLGQQPS